MNFKLVTAVAIVLQTAALGASAQESTRPADKPAMDHSNMDHSMHDKTMSKDKSGMDNMPVTTEAFVQKAALTNMTEIQLAKLALQKSQDDDIREFAQRMVEDHTEAGSKLKAVAGQVNATVPMSLDSEHKQMVSELQALDGDAFDKHYSMCMEKGHQETVQLFQNAADSNQVAQPIRQFAANTLPTLKKHSHMANELEETTTARISKMNNEQRTASDQ